jgi:cytochrome P450
VEAIQPEAGAATQGAPGLPPRFDPFAPDVRDDPYPAYERLRQAGGPCRGGPGQWVVPGYDDVAALLADRRLGNEFPPEYHSMSVGDGPAGAFLRRILLHQDRPRHTRLRRLLARAFTPAAVARLRDHIDELVTGLLATARASGRLEVVNELAFPLPVMVICELIGVPAGDRDEVRPRAFDLGRAFATSVTADGRRAADEAVTWMRGYIGGVLARRAKAPGDDLLSLMLTAEDSGDRLTHEEIVDNAVFLFFAGFETTSSLLANGCAALLDHPSQLARLRAEPGLVPAAVEEFLRYDAPIQSRLRLVREPIELGQRTLRPGRMVLLLIGSANRDGHRFADPDRLDVSRDPNPHLSFGGGIHYCLGASLARLEARVAFGRLLGDFSGFEPDGRPARQPESAFRTYARVPVAVTPR